MRIDQKNAKKTNPKRPKNEQKTKKNDQKRIKSSQIPPQKQPPKTQSKPNFNNSKMKKIKIILANAEKIIENTGL